MDNLSSMRAGREVMQEVGIGRQEYGALERAAWAGRGDASERQYCQRAGSNLVSRYRVLALAGSLCLLLM